MRRWQSLSALILALCACNSAQRLDPVGPQPIDWKQCPAMLRTPVPQGGWTNEKWIERDHVLKVQENLHFCIDVVAKSSEENQRRVMRNQRAYEEKVPTMSERLGYWMQGAGATTLLLAILAGLLL